MVNNVLRSSFTPVVMKNIGMKKPYPIDVNLSIVASLGSNNFITIPARKAPKMFSAPTLSATVTRVKIKKNANLISSCVVDLEILLNQWYGCLNRFSKIIATKNSKIISHKRPAFPPLIDA